MVAETAEATQKKTRKTSASARSMTKEHKAAIAEGREQARVVGQYLDALESHRPRRGRKVTEDSLMTKLAKIEDAEKDADPLERLNLLQQKKDAMRQLESLSSGVDIEPLKDGFVKVGKAYADRKQISRDTFREVGVPEDVLKLAGI